MKDKKGTDDRAAAIRSLLMRFLIALPFLITGGILLLPISAISIPAIILLMVGVFFLGRPLVELLTSSAGSILFNYSASNEVNLMFSIPESRVMEGKYEKALDLYREMIPKDPARLEIYLRIMKLAVRKMKQPEIASDTFRCGLGNLTDPDDRQTLAREYKELMEFQWRNR